VDDAERDAYLRRLGIEAEPPSVDALFRMHQAHVERVPWETLWIQLGDRWPVDPTVSSARVAATSRGGYCFHLNGAFSELLATLGYDVFRHVGGVHGPPGPAPTDLTNHLVLSVTGLPSDDNPSGAWYVDVGLGDALHDPVPLVSGEFEQAPFRMSIEAAPTEVADWHLTHDPGGGFTGMSWRSEPTEMDAFASMNEWLSTAPESGFVRFLTVQTRDATGVDVIRGLTLRRIGAGASDTDLTTKADLRAALGDLFGIDVASLDATAFDALWARVHAAHLEWDAAGRP
jgi:arylamine N-acetyltransferase